MQKGETKLALYGLGNIRDERLGRLFQTAGAVTWLQPDDAPGYPRTDWFNIFTLHQNRVTHGPKTRNYVQESQFPGFLDLVIWGHEHECKPDLEVGEAARKHYFVVDIKGQQWRHTRYALQSQRPFAYEAVTLREVTLPAPLNPENPDSINAYLESKVNSLIKKVTARQPDVSNVMLPLIRIKARIEDLIAENLHDNLKFLKEEELANALHKFVDKDEKHALAECVTQELEERLQASMARRVFEQTQANDEDLRSQLASVVKEERERKGPPPSASELITQRELSQIARDSAGEPERDAGGPSRAATTSEQGPMPPPSTTPTRGGRGGRGRGVKAPAAPKSTTTGRGRGRGGGRQATLADTLSRRASTSIRAQPSEEEDLDDEGTSRASTRPGKRTRPAPAAEDDVIENDDGPAPSPSRSEASTPHRNGGAAAVGRPERAAAQKKRQRASRSRAQPAPAPSHPTEDDIINCDEEPAPSGRAQQPSASVQPTPSSSMGGAASGRPAGRALPGSLSQGTSQSKGGGGKSGWGKAR
ncbi:hypothetical protein DUNSADRAFT_11625 [Dunaliella salina]|nr:hypothetical protein DUNSADRAFT_11625 [Dunaliella salina]|eukprot:KAF5832458.1 hypothetical protein DUNSADRAFT_11625 [Dunaliella salina]